MKSKKNLAKLALGAFLITSTSSVSADQLQSETKGWSETQGTFLASSCGGNGCGGRKVADNGDNASNPTRPTNGCNAKNAVRPTNGCNAKNAARPNNNNDTSVPQNYSSGCGGSSPTRPSNGCNGARNTNGGTYADRSNNNRNQYLSDNMEDSTAVQPSDDLKKAEDLKRQKQLKENNATQQNPSAWNNTNGRGY